MKKLAILAKENENLKLMNRQLMSEQMQKSSLVNNQDIYWKLTTLNWLIYIFLTL